MRDRFEIRDQDAAGRIGELEVPRAGVTVETPALLPVVNPHLQTVPPREMAAEFGAEMLITNGYVFHTSEEYRQRALDEGLHDLLDFPGAIMTDSGSFQLAEYGDIDVDTPEILRFQRDVGSDVGTPVDVPTPPDASRERAESDLAATEAAIAAAESVDVGDMLVNAPVQGSTYTDLREAAGERAAATDLDVFPVGAVVPLLNDYRYDDVVDVVAAAKRGLGPAAPVHLFGAGHPMMFALAVAVGCDLFDSAAYALYAREDRYLTVRGTERLDTLDYLPCACPVCVDRDAGSLAGADDDEREYLLARHNLHVTFGEVRRVKQALRRGDLLELVEARARAHPAMVDGYRTLLDHAEQLEATDPAAKDAFFHLSAEGARRPEVLRHHRRLGRLSVTGDRVLLTEGDDDPGFDETWRLVPPFGPFPRDLSNTYPLTAQVPERVSRSAREAAADGVARLADANPATTFAVGHRDWSPSALERLPERVARRNLRARDGDDDPDGDSGAGGSGDGDRGDDGGDPGPQV